MSGPTPLASRARSLGVATRYEDAGGVTRPVPEATVAEVCDLIEASGGARAPSDGPFEDVIVVRGGRITSGVRTDDPLEDGLPGGVEAELTLEDGTGLSAAGVAASELPEGIHRLGWSSARGDQHEATVIVAPSRFPPLPSRSSGVGPAAAVFVPTYALWSTGSEKPDFDCLTALADVVAGLGIECIATLPLFAPGLGSRFDPSPYSPISRFHLNELYATWESAEPYSTGDLVDWPAVVSDTVEHLDRHAQDLDDSARAELRAFLESRPDVVSYAEFCATEDVPQRIYEVGQWLAERSLDAAVADLHARGMRLALDLPVGSRPGGWEHTRWPQQFVDGASIGAPPDSFFGGGQDWGLAPVNPVASRRDGHRMWRDLLTNAARHADVLRIDHVMQVMRLWWVPAGCPATDGTYVDYPAEELLAVAALVAERTATTMVGEDLGTVPPEMVSLMQDWGLPGMHEELFALHDMAADRAVPPGGAVRPGGAVLPEVPRGSWAGLRTHDMMPVAAVAYEVDTEPYRRALGRDLGREVAPGVGSVTVAMVERLARSRAGAVVVDLDDALGSTAPHNVPGTVTDENWSHRLPVPVERLADEPGFYRTTTALNATTGQR